MGAMLKVLEGFRHWVARRVMWKMAWHMVDGEWGWPPVADALEISGICPIMDYIQQQQATIVVHIACRSSYS